MTMQTDEPTPQELRAAAVALSRVRWGRRRVDSLLDELDAKVAAGELDAEQVARLDGIHAKAHDKHLEAS